MDKLELEKQRRLLNKFEKQKNDTNSSHSAELDEKAKNLFHSYENWKGKKMAQEHDHRDKMFKMVHWMTIVTYVNVLILLLSQVTDISSDFPGIRFKELSDQRLAMVLTGFLAELLLLPKIIINGLFNGVIKKVKVK